MSHFSKIKTSITSLEILKKTIKDLGFDYKMPSKDNTTMSVQLSSNRDILFVYDSDLVQNQLPACSFEWNSDQYFVVVDLMLWNLDIDFDYFIERLLQQYAYNVVIKQSYSEGFHRVTEKLSDNGSISLTLQKF